MSADTKRPYAEAHGDLPADARAWLQEHPDVQPEEIEEVWQLADEAPPHGAAFALQEGEAAAMRQRLLDEIQASAEPTSSRASKIWILNRTWAAAAAVVLAAAVGALLLLQPVTKSAPAGRVAVVPLWDGSEVLLNSRSSITYKRTFGWWERSLELEGEGFFDVVSGSEPFEVQTFNGIVAVVGTHFNVRAHRDDAALETRVIVTEGTVTLAGLDIPSATVTVRGGQMSLVTDGGRPSAPEEVDAERLLIWRIGGMAYADATIDVVLADLRRRFGIDVNASEDVLNRRVSLFMTDVDNPETVLEVLAGMHGLELSKEGDAWELVAVE